MDITLLKNAHGNNIMTNISNLQSIFTDIYTLNKWESNESQSGSGSTLEFTSAIKQFLIEFINTNNINTFLDTSCGDWNWMKTIQSQLCDYTGIDIVENIVKDNNIKYGNQKTKFIHDDFLHYLKTLPPKSLDLILCRHTLEHLPTNYNLQFIEEAKRVSKYLLLTTHDLASENKELPDSIYRPINLKQSPYTEQLNLYFCKSIYDGSLNNYTPETYINLYDFNNMDFSVFKGGWSYMAQEMQNAVSLLPQQKNLSVLEFGSGDSSIKLFNLLSKKYKVDYTTFESNKDFYINHTEINCLIYDEIQIEKLNIHNNKYDFILIDGPNGVLRKHWYSKITQNVKKDTIILIDDWCHYDEFEQALINDFGSKIKYEVIETRKEYDPNSAPHLGYKSWKIIKVI